VWAVKQYAVYVTNLQYGCAHVEAETPQEAEQKARELNQHRSIDWYDEEISDISVEEE
jgi:hypothetical protein